MKGNNSAWGYLRIAIHMWSLHIFISPSTVRRILLKPERYPDKETKPPKEEKPFLIITASKPNSMWSLDLTTLHLFGIFPVYILGVIDHYSRKVFSLSTTFHPASNWVIDECKALFEKHGTPNRIITDNGSQFTSNAFKACLQGQGIKHIRTSVRHPQTNGKIERFFQSLKYEFMCFFFLRNKRQVDKLLADYLLYYNQYRLHQAINGQTPDNLYYNKPIQKPPKHAKRIRAPIEELHFGNSHLKAYQYKEAA
ncbi:MAG: DDE-type integrase/transposase/recombinase [Deltaproteobacteria bacterium]|nr:DDE-type integrase/transposase/recombinase [Deltaproteobacteria bacterium]